jgi:hypothetical protein
MGAQAVGLVTSPQAPVSIGFSLARPFTAGWAVIEIFRGRFTALFLRLPAHAHSAEASWEAW